VFASDDALSCGDPFIVVMNRRVLELLSGDWTLSGQLRVPAISRMQKVHNVGVTFAALTRSGADMDSLKGRTFFVSGCD